MKTAWKWIGIAVVVNLVAATVWSSWRADFNAGIAEAHLREVARATSRANAAEEQLAEQRRVAAQETARADSTEGRLNNLCQEIERHFGVKIKDMDEYRQLAAAHARRLEDAKYEVEAANTRTKVAETQLGFQIKEAEEYHQLVMADMIKMNEALEDAKCEAAIASARAKALETQLGIQIKNAEERDRQMNEALESKERELDRLLGEVNSLNRLVAAQQEAIVFVAESGRQKERDAADRLRGWQRHMAVVVAAAKDE